MHSRKIQLRKILIELDKLLCYDNASYYKQKFMGREIYALHVATVHRLSAHTKHDDPYLPAEV